MIAKRLRKLKHLRIDLVNLLHPHLKNLPGCEIGGGFFANIEKIARLAIR